VKLGDFIDRVCEEYGGSVRDTKGASLSALPGGKASLMRFVTRTDEKGSRWVLPIPPRINADTEVADPVLYSLCEQLGIKPADFGVAKEEPVED